jgi:hypothetical protein
MKGESLINREVIYQEWRFLGTLGFADGVQRGGLAVR